MQKHYSKLEKLYKDFNDLRNPNKKHAKFSKKIENIYRNKVDFLAPWIKLSQEDPNVYPSQGLIQTPYDYLSTSSTQMLPQEKILKTIILRFYFLEMFNHQYRINFLRGVTTSKFKKVPNVVSEAFEYAAKRGLSLSIGDLGASVTGSNHPRISRTERYAQGPFIKLGKQARTIFVGSESPDVWNSEAAISTMAASHCLTAIPRNGLMADIKRQTKLARRVFAWLTDLESFILKNRIDRKFVSDLWKHNVMGALEASPEKALRRAEALYKMGVSCFRVYSPEPGTGPELTTKLLRDTFGDDIEIFTGQLVDVDQAKRVEEAGADGIFVGIGGGGRCITGVRSGSVIDWPELVWKMRGKIGIPVIVQGGASDHVAVTMLLGASGIGVSRIVAGGTLESPGGALYAVDESGKLFKPYGGEASARTKYLEGKLLPFDIPTFVEGETTKAEISFVKHALPTLTYNLHMLLEDSILAMVFRNAKSISELHNISPSPLRIASFSDQTQRNTH